MTLFDDLDPFFTDEFAVQATGTFGEISVVFDQSYSEGDWNLFLREENTVQPPEARTITATCRTSDSVGLSRGSAMTIQGTEYKVTSLQPVDDGLLTRVVLSE